MPFFPLRTCLLLALGGGSTVAAAAAAGGGGAVDAKQHASNSSNSSSKVATGKATDSGRGGVTKKTNGLSNSKLSIHTAMGANSWAVINQARPRIVKVLDNFGDDIVQMKVAAPGMQVVGRIYLSNQQQDGDPAVAALAWLDQVGPLCGGGCDTLRRICSFVRSFIRAFY